MGTQLKNNTLNTKEQLIVMIIDDSKIVVDRLVTFFEELPNVEIVHYGFSYEDGERLLKERQIDVAVLDINLNGKSGIELLQLIKKNAKTSRIVVIMMTDDPADSKKQLCSEAGADHFIDKYNEFENITNIIASLCPTHGIKKEDLPPEPPGGDR